MRGFGRVAGIVYPSRADFDAFGGLPDGALSNEGREVASSTAATDILVLSAHGLATDAPVTVRAVEGGTLSAPLVAGTTYYAIRLTDDTFKLSATPGGSPIDLTTSGVTMFVTKQLPIDLYLEAFSRWVEDCVPAHLVPFAVDTGGAYPIFIRKIICQLAGAELLNRAGKDSAAVRQGQIDARAILERWGAGKPLRDPGITASANLAVTSTLSGTSVDPRGWGSGSLP